MKDQDAHDQASFGSAQLRVTGRAERQQDCSVASSLPCTDLSGWP
jgi:hypothetical protein